MPFNLKEKINAEMYRGDLKSVLIKGLLAMIAFSVLFGVVDGFLALVGFPLSLGILLIGFAIGRRIESAYDNYHIIYSFISVAYTLIGYLLYFFSYICALKRSIDGTFSMLFDGSFFRLVIQKFYLGFTTGTPLSIFLEIIYILFFIAMFFIAFKSATRKD